jgi:hypothetical protein
VGFPADVRKERRECIILSLRTLRRIPSEYKNPVPKIIIKVKSTYASLNAREGGFVVERFGLIECVVCSWVVRCVRLQYFEQSWLEHLEKWKISVFLESSMNVSRKITEGRLLLK